MVGDEFLADAIRQFHGQKRLVESAIAQIPEEALFTRLCPQFEARLGVPQAEGAELIAAAVQECETHQANAICTFAVGRRPD